MLKESTLGRHERGKTGTEARWIAGAFLTGTTSNVDFYNTVLIFINHEHSIPAQLTAIN
jgi:hypothetical protein